MTKNKSCCAVCRDPLLILLLGACPAMAVTVNVLAGLTMGLAATVIMVLTGLTVSLLKKLIPARVKVPACILVATGYTALVQMLLHAFLPEAYAMLGIYLALIAVSALVWRNADAAAETAPAAAVKDALSTGLFFTLCITVVAVIREVFGAASFAGLEIGFLKDCAVSILVKPFGGFVVLAIVAAVISAVRGCKEGE